MDFDFLFITLLLIVTGFFIVKKEVIVRIFNRKSTSKDDFKEADETILSFVKKYQNLDSETLVELLHTESLDFTNTKAIEKILRDRQNLTQ